MIERFFYTDPLAAAWMAKHFGMVFNPSYPGRTDITPNAIIHQGWFDRHWLGDCQSEGISQINRFYLHPDSLHLLAPKNGDKVSYSFGVGPHVGEAWDEVKGMIYPNDEGYPYTGNGEPYVLVDGCDEFPISRLKEIFQRDGKPFFWPAREAA